MKRNAWILMILAVTVMTLLTTLTTFADSRYSEREMGRRNGYEYGSREGREDRRDRRSFDFRRNRIYRDGTIGCRESFDCEDDYRDAFRQGFENGYRTAYYQGGRGNHPWWERDRYDRDDDCDVFGRPRRRRW